MTEKVSNLVKRIFFLILYNVIDTTIVKKM